MNFPTPLITFPVSDVEVSNELLPTTFYSEAVSAFLNVSPKARMCDLFDDHSKTLELKIEATSSKDSLLVQLPPRQQGNAFMLALNTAYDKHLPLSLSPDMIWLLISQGIAQHLTLNPSDGPAHLNSDSKTKIKVRRDVFIKGSGDNDWAGSIFEFNLAIKALAGPEFYDQIVQQFSTTGETEAVAMGITLMEAASPYFDYGMLTMCGFPSISLEGTVEDWELLYNQAVKITNYGLDWWWMALEPVLAQFVASARGDVNVEFWRDFYKLNEMSGGPYINGHVVNLFAYLKNRHKKNQLERNSFSHKEYALTSANFPGGLSAADFEWEYYTEKFNMRLIAGFVGFAQHPDTFVVRPEIGWAVAELVKSKIKPPLKPEPKRLTPEEQSERDKPYETRVIEAIEKSKIHAGVFYSSDATRAIQLQNEFSGYPEDKRKAILAEYGSVYDWSKAEASKSNSDTPSTTRPSFRR